MKRNHFLRKAYILLALCAALSPVFSTNKPIAKKDLSFGLSINLWSTSHYSNQLLILFNGSKMVYHDLFIDGLVGAWVNPGTVIVGAGAGFVDGPFSISISPSLISAESESQSNHLQFVVMAKFYIPNSEEFIDFSHISNGNEIFGSGKPNKGEDFISIGKSL